jgi:hypothetical protein
MGQLEDEMTGIEKMRAIVRWADQHDERWFDVAPIADLVAAHAIVSAAGYGSLEAFFDDDTPGLKPAQESVSALLTPAPRPATSRRWLGPPVMTRDELAIRDALCTESLVEAETAAMLIDEMGLDRAEVADNFSAWTSSAARAICRACKTPTGFGSLKVALHTLV